MTNAEKYKSAEERRAAYEDYCVECGKKNMMLKDVFKWLEMEYKDHKEELLSCPFCGSTPVMADNIESMKSLSYYVKCVCGARVASALSARAAAEMWNRRVKMTSNKEKYIISWLYNNGVWSIGCVTNKYDEAIKSINSFKCHDKRCGKEYKYRITKQTIQEEVMYND